MSTDRPEWMSQDMREAARDRLEHQLALAAYRWAQSDPETVAGDEVAAAAIDEMIDISRRLKQLGGPREVKA